MDSDKKAFDITVNKSNPKPAPALPVEDTKSSDESGFKIPVRSNMSAAPETPAATEPVEDPVIREKVVIAPIDEAPTISEEVEEPQDEKKEEPAEVTPSVSTETPTTEPIAASEPKVEESSQSTPTETSSSPATKTTTEETETQMPNVFDTKQYHLPIKESKSHNAGKHMLGFIIVFILVVIIGVVVATDAGWLNIGLKLPFDLIK